jgi:hypothetical protein
VFLTGKILRSKVQGSPGACARASMAMRKFFIDVYRSSGITNSKSLN